MHALTMPRAAVPPGTVAVEPEVRAVVTSLSQHARGRFIELQFATEPHLLARCDAALFRTCLRSLLVAAIERAQSGVLLTATGHPDSVEIAVLDDGVRQPGRPEPSDATTPHAALPGDATLRVDYQTGRGSTMVLSLPRHAAPALPFEPNDEVCIG